MHTDPKTLDALNAPRQHPTHPKAMYHPDGRYCEVASEAEELALDAEWQTTPVDHSAPKADEQAPKRRGRPPGSKNAAGESDSVEVLG